MKLWYILGSSVVCGVAANNIPHVNKEELCHKNTVSNGWMTTRYMATALCLLIFEGCLLRQLSESNAVLIEFRQKLLRHQIGALLCLKAWGSI